MNELEKLRKSNFEKEIIKKIEELKNKRGQCASVFKLRDAVTGSKKKHPEPTVLIDLETNLEFNNVEEIK